MSLSVRRSASACLTLAVGFVGATTAASGTAIAGAASTATAADPDVVLDFCLANPGRCAISVHAITAGWERHLNPDRPQSLGSTYKALMLLAYAQAVATNGLDPDDTISREEWARYLTIDGGAFVRSWEDLGRPNDVSYGDLARMMILHSDNAAPDILGEELGKKAIKKAIKLLKGFHDLPLPLSSMFGLWRNGNGIGGTGARIARDYGGFGSGSYVREAESFFKGLRKDPAVQTMRESMCFAPPWENVTCTPPNPDTSAGDLRRLTGGYFTRSTTRTYANMMRGLLEGTLLPPRAADVALPIIEQWLVEFPTLAATFSRYGLKGGSLSGGPGPLNVVTWATFIENLVSRERFVVILFLQNMKDARRPPSAIDVRDFAQQFAVSQPFRNRVRDRLDEDDLRDEVVPLIKRVRRTGQKITVKARVDNAGPRKTSSSSVVRLFLSEDAELDNGDVEVASANVPVLKGNKGKNVTLRGNVGPDAAGMFAILVVDADDDLDEQDEDNNALWELIK